MILTSEQTQELAFARQLPVRMENPETGETYYLVRATDFEAMLDEAERREAEATFPGIAEAFADWNDPEMDIYNELDPRR
jgi:hypothetical protein